mmetsp:Transcript_106031/g.253067  ORF Transcript_106031/g.253067 Transcript_106031/m.253067 type:complete len:200 (-) Transcript_106031:1650-2249(-)
MWIFAAPSVSTSWTLRSSSKTVLSLCTATSRTAARMSAFRDFTSLGSAMKTLQRLTASSATRGSLKQYFAAAESTVLRSFLRLSSSPAEASQPTCSKAGFTNLLLKSLKAEATSSSRPWTMTLSSAPSTAPSSDQTLSLSSPEKPPRRSTKKLTSEMPALQVARVSESKPILSSAGRLFKFCTNRLKSGSGYKTRSGTC